MVPSNHLSSVLIYSYGMNLAPSVRVNKLFLVFQSTHTSGLEISLRFFNLLRTLTERKCFLVSSYEMAGHHSCSSTLKTAFWARKVLLFRYNSLKRCSKFRHFLQFFIICDHVIFQICPDSVNITNMFV